MNVEQQLVNGLVIGAGYALVALGWTVLLGAARLVNFGHGQLYMLGAFVCWFAIERLGLPYLAAVPVAVAAVALVGAVMQALMMRLVIEQNLVSIMIVTLGFGYMIEGGAVLLFGGDPRMLPSPYEATSVYWGDLWFTVQDVLIVLLTLVLFALTWLVLNRTRIGAVVRSIAEDPRLSQLTGVNPAVVYLGVFVFEAAVVALAAAVIATRSPILPSMGFNEVILTFVVVVLGGIGSVGGSLVAGFALGMFTAFFGALVSPAYTTAAAFTLLLAFLAVRPEGLMVR